MPMELEVAFVDPFTGFQTVGDYHLGLSNLEVLVADEI